MEAKNTPPLRIKLSFIGPDNKVIHEAEYASEEEAEEARYKSHSGLLEMCNGDQKKVNRLIRNWEVEPLSDFTQS